MTELFNICLTDGSEIWEIRYGVTREEWIELNEEAYKATDGNISWDGLPDDNALDGTGNSHLTDKGV